MRSLSTTVLFLVVGILLAVASCTLITDVDRGQVSTGEDGSGGDGSGGEQGGNGEGGLGGLGGSD